MKGKDWIYIVIIFLVLLLFLARPVQTPYPSIESVTRIDTVYRIDTVFIPTTVIRTKVSVLRDTTRQEETTYPFVAVMDTVDPQTKDTISIKYEYPESIFTYINRYHPRYEKTVMVHRQDTIKITVPMQASSSSWYEEYLRYIGFIAAGYIIGRIR